MNKDSDILIVYYLSESSGNFFTKECFVPVPFGN